MIKRLLLYAVVLGSLAAGTPRVCAQQKMAEPVDEAARPWVYWYWMNSLVSRAGVRADLMAMKEAGIGGAYLMAVRANGYDTLRGERVKVLSPGWWQLLGFTFRVADSLGLGIAMAGGDGWATAGGPWITPALSMQRVVWSETHVKGGRLFADTLPRPPSYQDYYRDIAVYAYPSVPGTGRSSLTVPPAVSTSTGDDASFLAVPDNTRNFVSHRPCWIQYRFREPFVLRSLKIKVRGTSFQPFRLIIEASDDGRTFRRVWRLTPPRAGWEDYKLPEATFSIPEVRAKYFRFVYDPAGTEPGSEDLDAAKWKPVLKLTGITLYSKAQINQFEGKNGELWRVSARTDTAEVPDALAVPLRSIVRLSAHMDTAGVLRWQVPPGDWTILRMGYTSTGAMNSYGGGAHGLEVDKFNPAAVRLQFDRWFKKTRDTLAAAGAADVLKIFHVDSWECGSQNWSPVFRQAFIRYRGYDPLAYLPAMAGVPVQSADVSERFLYDIRHTIAQLVGDNFFGTLGQLTAAEGCLFSAEAVAPTMVSDGMLTAAHVDIPMGEFWLRSPTHDKPNDVADAVSGAHIYGRRLVQAESFTEIREGWDEYPGMLKTLLDRNYAMGINRAAYHVFTENPWTDRTPGMTLTGIGLYFQRDQTWWKPGRAWVDYAIRCQGLLQKGVARNDLAVFTGWEVPRRALTPDRLVPVLPGLIGSARVAREKTRLRNRGEPTQERPRGITSAANLYDPARWVDPLRGYGYDCINEDALLRLASVQDGRIVLPGGASYGVLVIPGTRRMQPEGDIMSAPVARQLVRLVRAGATVLIMQSASHAPGLGDYPNGDKAVRTAFQELTGGSFRSVAADSGSLVVKRLGQGRVIKGPYRAATFQALGLPRDIDMSDEQGAYASGMAWTHRVAGDTDIYFIANQLDTTREVTVSLRASGRIPEVYDPVTGVTHPVAWHIRDTRTVLTLHLAPAASRFVILTKPTGLKGGAGLTWHTVRTLSVGGSWQVSFDSTFGGPAAAVDFPVLRSWTTDSTDSIRYYSGTAVYRTHVQWSSIAPGRRVWLSLGKVCDIASVRINGKQCGVAWTAPYRVDITDALREGDNLVEISVTNTWANRLIGDAGLPASARVTWTTAPFYLEGTKLLPSGLLGPVTLREESAAK